MNTYIWLIGGVMAAMTLALIFLQIFSNMTNEENRQNSISNFNKIVANINKFCSMEEGQTAELSISFPSIMTELFAFDTGIIKRNNRTLGNQLCMNVSGDIYCKKVDCQIELDEIKTEKTISSFIDRILKKQSPKNYRLSFIRTKCGVSILRRNSRPICKCDLSGIEVPIYCEYNGEQPILMVQGKAVVLADTYNWIHPVNETKYLLYNIANYLPGKKILVVYEENITDPNEENRSKVLDWLKNQGYTITIKKHDSKITNFENYEQVWLITPGFCEEESRECQDYVKWSPYEVDGISNFVKKGGGLFLMTDSGMKRQVYERVGLRVINEILKNIGFPLEQIQSCVCGCIAGRWHRSNIRDHNLTENIYGFNVSAAAVFRCRYEYYSSSR